MTRSRADIIDDVRIQIAEYVKLRERLHDPITFHSALSFHRRGVEAALRDTPNDDDLRERLGFLDDLCTQEGVRP